METLVYAICFCVGLLFTLLSAFFGHLFGGHEGHTDIGTGGHAEAGYTDTGMPGLSPFSPTTICSFITAFGGFGMIFSSIEATSNVWISLPLSTLGRVDRRRGGVVGVRLDFSQDAKLQRRAYRASWSARRRR